jgi:hypothetical protein
LLRRGEYRYFAYPLPALVQQLRAHCYPHLQPLAQEWNDRLGGRRLSGGPRLLATPRRRSASPPLLLRVVATTTACQDVYGEVALPLDAGALSQQRYDGGEIVLIEQRPRAQSRAYAFQLERGDALIFTNRSRPVRGTRGWYSVQMRHGISPLLRGSRYVLGVIFHDAR